MPLFIIAQGKHSTRSIWKMLNSHEEMTVMSAPISTLLCLFASLSVIAVSACGSSAASTPSTNAPVPGSFSSLTAAQHLSGSSAESNVTINMSAVGAGVNGPLNAQTGLSVFAIKDNWFSGPASVGEIDGINVFMRQGGQNSDGSGILVNVQNTGTGFLAMDEMVSSIFDPSQNIITQEIDVQDGVLNKLTGDYIGRVFNADVGQLKSAILVQNTASTSTWGNVLVNSKNGVQNFAIDDNGNLNAQTVVAAGTIQMGNLTFSQLPAAGIAGRMIFCRDCLKPGEPGGAGSGMMLFDDGRTWISTAGIAAGH